MSNVADFTKHLLKRQNEREETYTEVDGYHIENHYLVMQPAQVVAMQRQQAWNFFYGGDLTAMDAEQLLSVLADVLAKIYFGATLKANVFVRKDLEGNYSVLVDAMDFTRVKPAVSEGKTPVSNFRLEARFQTLDEPHQWSGEVVNADEFYLDLPDDQFTAQQARRMLRNMNDLVAANGGCGRLAKASEGEVVYVVFLPLSARRVVVVALAFENAISVSHD